MDKFRYRLTDVSEPQMVLHGQREAVIEQCGEIALYDSRQVQLRFGKSWMRISGTGLELRAMGPGGVTVRGSIADICVFEGGFPCSD